MTESQWTNDSPIKVARNSKTTAATIKEILKDGTPKWLSHPEDYRAMAEEDYLSWKENSDSLAAAFQLDKQYLLTDRKARMHRLMGTREFIKTLRDNEVKCFTYQSEWTPEIPEWLKNTVGLWAEIPGESNRGHLYEGIRYQYVCFMGIPCMYEWSLLITDEHHLPAGERRGWRTVLSQLIKKGVLTEEKAHRIFGPPYGDTSSIYQNTLYEFRNRRRQNA